MNIIESGYETIYTIFNMSGKLTYFQYWKNEVLYDSDCISNSKWAREGTIDNDASKNRLVRNVLKNIELGFRSQGYKDIILMFTDYKLIYTTEKTTR